MTSANPQYDNVNEKVTGWLEKNRDAFGRKILCAGIEISAAVHLSRLFPDSSIVCLTDQNPSEADRDLKGPLVIQSPIEDYDGGLFDTVVCFSAEPLLPPHLRKDDAAGPSRQWLHGDQTYPVMERGTLYLRRASLLMEYYENAANILRRHLRDGGTLLNLVRSEHDEHLLGYCFALASEEMNVHPSSIRQILCRENGKRLTMQAIRATAGERSRVSELIAENLNFSLDRMNTAANELEEKDAEILLQADAASLIRGYHLYQGDDLKGKLALYASSGRKDVIYYFTDVEGDVPYLRRFHKDDKEKVLRHMVGEMHRQKAADKNVKWHELVLNDDWSETEL